MVIIKQMCQIRVVILYILSFRNFGSLSRYRIILTQNGVQCTSNETNIHILWMLAAVCDGPQLDHGTVDFTVPLEGGIANYTCKEGYTLRGSSTRLCMPNGIWSGSDPFCEGTCFGNKLVRPLRGSPFNLSNAGIAIHSHNCCNLRCTHLRTCQ